MTRLFAFGCSFTNYEWSTWADLLADEFDEFQNWGCAGAGNHNIFNSVMEADQRHCFGVNDTVVVCWSSIFREDRYVRPNNWISLGNIYYSDLVQRDFIDQCLDFRGCLIRDLAMIKATKVLLESRDGLTWRFLSMVPLMTEERTWFSRINDNDTVALYKNVVDCILPSYLDVIGRCGPKDVPFPDGSHPKHGADTHPSPMDHLRYLDNVLPGWITKLSTRERARTETDNLVRRKHGGGGVDRL